MSSAIYLSHPEVLIDPLIPVPQWPLSDTGRERAEKFGRKLKSSGITRIVSSAETKAIETARIIATALSLPVEVHPDMGENDRSSTGYLPKDIFERLADDFFATPYQSVMGWEPARIAQLRILAAVDRLLDRHERSRPLLLVGHGAVGTLLWCVLQGLPISRTHDQAGAGNAYAFSLASRRVLCEWTRIEDWEHSQWAES